MIFHPSVLFKLTDMVDSGEVFYSVGKGKPLKRWHISQYKTKAVVSSVNTDNILITYPLVEYFRFPTRGVFL